jgi:hypothetical protein
MLVDDPPVKARDSKTDPSAGDMSWITYVELGPSVSRIISPTLAHLAVHVMLTTLAERAKLLVNALNTKRNVSEVPQMSTPEPLTVKVSPEMVNDPAAPTLPMSSVSKAAGEELAAAAETGTALGEVSEPFVAETV